MNQKYCIRLKGMVCALGGAVTLAGFAARADEVDLQKAPLQWLGPQASAATNQTAYGAGTGMTPARTQPAGTVVYDGWTLTSGGPNDQLQFQGLQAGVGYELELEFLAWRSDGSGISIGRITANGQTLAEQVAVGTIRDRSPLPPAQRWSLPTSALQQPTLDVRLENIGLTKDGKMLNQVPHPIAIHVTVRSAVAGAPALTAALPAKIEVPAVRLSPRPAAVAGLKALQVDLGGEWSVNLSAPTNFWAMAKAPAPAKGTAWLPIQVPGELGLQVPSELPGTPVAYCRDFCVPKNWNGKRIKLKCDAIFNDAQVWVNGVPVGSHRGNFTPFELDITAAIRPGQPNVLAVLVKWDETTDKLASASEWVGHRIMGIVRKIYLFAVPEVNVADVQVLTRFDQAYSDATLTAKVRVVNESTQPWQGGQLRLELRERPKGREAAAPVTVNLPELAPGASWLQEATLQASAPKKWDVEHPNLHDLGVTLLKDGQELAVVKERLGLRQIEIRGKQVFINNHPVSYRGVNWMDKDPLKGCALSSEDRRRDIRLLRSLNCNYLRYTFFATPAAEELVEACDELGLFLSAELPVTWTSRIGPQPLAAVLQAAVELLTRDRNRASIVQWSLGNELEADQNLQIAYRLAMLPLDDSRPWLVDGSWHAMDFLTPHYRAVADLTRDVKGSLPVLQGESAHPACYNRPEHYTDPGMRDLWGLGVANEWDKMVGVAGYLGQSVWTGIDDWTVLPEGDYCGWGEWGILDVWRRLKPEAWHFKKIFSPIRIFTTQAPWPAPGQPLRLPVENRYIFSDLNESRFEWTLGAARGSTTASVASGTRGELAIALPAKARPGVLELKAYNPERGMVDAWRITVGERPAPTTPAQAPAQPVELVRRAERFDIICGDRTWEVDARSGKLVAASVQGKRLALGGPDLLLLPNDQFRYLYMFFRDWQHPANYRGESWSEQKFGRYGQWAERPQPETAPCTGWTATAVQAEQCEGGVEVRVTGRYQEAEGGFVLRFSGDGRLEARYDFRLTETLLAAAKAAKGQSGKELIPRQLGLVFEAPSTCDRLQWRRQAQWTYYPEDQIGRPEGMAKAFPGTPVCRGLFYRQAPTWPWSQDTTPQGSADFRSTKAFIYEAALTNAKGLGLYAFSDGTQHARAWVDNGKNCLLVADVHREQIAGYDDKVAMPSPKLKLGDNVRGRVCVTVQARRVGNLE